MGMADRGPTHVYNDFSFWLELLYITHDHLVHRVFHPHFICSKKNLRMMPQSCNLRSAVEEWLGSMLSDERRAFACFACSLFTSSVHK